MATKTESEYVKKQHSSVKAARKNRPIPIRDYIAPDVFIPARNSFRLGKYNFRPLDVMDIEGAVPAAVCESFYTPNTDVIVTESFQKISDRVLRNFLEKTEQSAKTQLLIAKDASKVDVNIQEQVIQSVEESKNYLLKGGSFWNFEMKIFTRIKEDDVKNDIEWNAHDQFTSELSNFLAGIGFKVRSKMFRMKKYLNFLAPIAYREADFSRASEYRPFTTEALVNLFPVVMASDLGRSGDVYGIDVGTGLPVIMDRFSFPSYHMVVVGQTGGGKSFFVKVLMLRYMLRDPEVKVFILDPLGEYKNIAENLNGIVIDMSKNVVNPLDIMTTSSKENPKGDVSSKVNRVLTMLGAYLKEMNDQMRSIINGALVKLYTGKSGNATFTLLIDEIKQRPDYDQNVNAQMVVESLRIFTEGSLSGFNQRTNVPLDRSITVFDLSAIMDQRMKEFFLFFMVDFLQGQVSMNYERKLVFVEEAYYFMMHEETANFINNFVRHARHYNCGVTLMTQSISDFYTEEGGKFSISTLNDAFSVAVFYSKDIPEKFVEAHGLTPGEVEYIRTGTGLKDIPGYGKESECLLIQKEKRYRLRVVGLPTETELAETNPDVLRKRMGLKNDKIEKGGHE